MNRGHIHSAKLGKTQRKPTAAGGLVLGILCLPLFFWTLCRPSTRVNSIVNVSDDSSSSPLYWDWSDAASPPPAKPLADRPVYPYSVIPGGAHSGRELLEAAQREPVVAAHYAAFAVRNAREIRLADDKRAYVSYRLGNRIYWTKKKVTLHKGEILLTDGQHLARTRCGNRVSETPTEPTSPSEPKEIVLNDPLPPRIPVITTGSPLPGPIWPGSTPLLTMPDTPAGSIPGLPFFPPIPCCGSPTGTSHSPSPALLPQPYPPPLVATPEPNSLVLLTVGSAVLLLFWKFYRPCLIFLSSSWSKQNTCSRQLTKEMTYALRKRASLPLLTQRRRPVYRSGNRPGMLFERFLPSDYHHRHI